MSKTKALRQIPITFCLTEEHIRKLQIMADEQKRARSQIIREIVEAYLERR
jgi:predicted DNA-binding protein